MTDTSTRPRSDSDAGSEVAGPDQPTAGPRLFGPRGRHRRPHPRRVLLAAGGLALAAGALSLVRLAPDAGVGGAGSAEAEPHPGLGPGTDRSSNTAATVGAAPKVSPSATSVMGSLSTSPTPDTSLASGPTATTTAPASTAVITTIPDTTGLPAPRPPASTSAAAPQPTTHAPTPTPSRTPSPAPQPERPGHPGVCVPVIGLCLGPQARSH